MWTLPKQSHNLYVKKTLMPVACRIHPLSIYYLCECSMHKFWVIMVKLMAYAVAISMHPWSLFFSLICSHVSFSNHSRRLQCVGLICSYLVHTSPWWVMSTYGNQFSTKQTAILLIVRTTISLQLAFRRTFQGF